MSHAVPRLVLLSLLMVFVASCASRRTASQPSHRYGTAATREVVTGRASYYGKRFHGRKTASGERFDMYAMTAAHRTLPFGTLVRVTNTTNGNTVVVRINDRGPFGDGSRVIDVSQGAAEALGMIRAGIATVTLEVTEPAR